MKAKKVWKIIFGVTLSIGILYILALIGMAIYCYTEDTQYPYPALGTDVCNWFDAFYIMAYLTTYVFGAPLIINVVLFIISIIKIKRRN